MRRAGRVSGVSIASIATIVAAGLMLGACGSSGSNAAPATSTTVGGSIVTTTTKPPTTTTKPVNKAAADELTQLALTAALKGAESIFHGTGDYTAVTPERLMPLAPGTRFGALDQAGASVVGVLAQDRHDVFMVTRSASGRWYCVTENDTDGVSYGAGPTFDSVKSNGDCQADAWPAPGTAS